MVVEELSTRMAAMGHDVTCFNRSGNHVGGKEFNMDMGAEYRGVRLRRVPTVERKGLAAVTSSFFASLYSAVGKFDVVHIHAEGPAVFCWLPKLFGKKVCVSIHGLDHLRAKWKGKIGARYIRLGEKMAVRHADEIIVLGRDVQKYFEEAYGRRTRLIPNGASRPAFAPPELIRERFGLDRDSYILYLGRIVPEKGGHYLVRAFRDVDTKKKLVIAGGASDSAEYLAGLKTLAEGDGRVIFTGFVQGRLLEELYSNAYIYCLPSDLEGMPLSLLEAMGYGNCCLTSDIPECVEAVGFFHVFRHQNLVPKQVGHCQNKGTNHQYDQRGGCRQKFVPAHKTKYIRRIQYYKNTQREHQDQCYPKRFHQQSQKARLLPIGIIPGHPGDKNGCDCGGNGQYQSIHSQPGVVNADHAVPFHKTQHRSVEMAVYRNDNRGKKENHDRLQMPFQMLSPYHFPINIFPRVKEIQQI